MGVEMQNEMHRPERMAHEPRGAHSACKQPILTLRGSAAKRLGEVARLQFWNFRLPVQVRQVVNVGVHATPLQTTTSTGTDDDGEYFEDQPHHPTSRGADMSMWLTSSSLTGNQRVSATVHYQGPVGVKPDMLVLLPWPRLKLLQAVEPSSLPKLAGYTRSDPNVAVAPFLLGRYCGLDGPLLRALSFPAVFTLCVIC